MEGDVGPFDLYQSHSIPAHFSIIAVDRVELSDDTLRKRLYEGVTRFAHSGQTAVKEWTEFSRRIRYLQGDFNGGHSPLNLPVLLKVNR